MPPVWWKSKDVCRESRKEIGRGMLENCQIVGGSVFCRRSTNSPRTSSRMRKKIRGVPALVRQLSPAQRIRGDLSRNHCGSQRSRKIRWRSCAKRIDGKPQTCVLDI